MATLFKRKRKVKLPDGKIVVRQSLKWHTKLTDADGVKRTIPLFKDKIASQQRAAQLQREIELARSGVADRYKEYRKKPLAEHLEDYHQAQLDRGSTVGHANLARNRIRTVLEACRCVFIRDIEPSRIQNHIAERKRAGLSARSCNHYLTNLKAFFNWLVSERRTAENPLAHLKGFNAKKDIRRQRRVLGPLKNWGDHKE